MEKVTNEGAHRKPEVKPKPPPSSISWKLTSTKKIGQHSGSPDVYNIKPKKQKFGSMTRMTVGEKDVNKVNKTILLVGETGAGKSTLVNALLNYIMGVKWEQKVWYQIVEEEEERSQTESQTSDVIVYEIFGYEDRTLPYSLTIIDTPGFGDTRGAECDDNIYLKLSDLFEPKDHAFYEVHAVGLVMKATDNRLSDRLKYIFDSVSSLFGKNMEENIVALITHSDGITPENALKALEVANIKCAKSEKNKPVYFLFNNHQNKKRTEEDMRGLMYAWEVTERGMEKFTAYLQKANPQNTINTLKVLQERIRLTACIQNLKERIKQTELKQTEIRQIQEALEKHEEAIKENECFTIEVDEVYKTKEIIDGKRWGLGFYKGAVCCTHCEETCHYPGCTISRSPEHCEVMKRGKCTVCTSKCPASAHVKENWRYVIMTKKVQKQLEDVERIYNHNKSERENKFSLLENLKMEMDQLTTEKSELLDESYQHVVGLEQIALKSDSASTIVHLDFLIEKMKEKGDREKILELQAIRNRVDEESRAALRYRFAQLSVRLRT